MSRLINGERIREPSTVSWMKALAALCMIVPAMLLLIAFVPTETRRGTARRRTEMARVFSVVSGARADASLSTRGMPCPPPRTPRTKSAKL